MKDRLISAFKFNSLRRAVTAELKKMTNVLELCGGLFLSREPHGTFSINLNLLSTRQKLREEDEDDEGPKNSSEVIQISFDNKRAQMEEMCHPKNGFEEEKAGLATAKVKCESPAFC